MKHSDRLIQTNLVQNSSNPPAARFKAPKSTVDSLVALALAEDIGVLIQWATVELGLLPQVGSEEAVGVGDGDEGGLESVLERLGGSGRGGVDVLDTSQLQQTLDGWRSDQAGTARSWDQLETYQYLNLRCLSWWNVCLP